MRVIFAGTPVFAAAALEAIVQAGFTVPLVLTQPDRPSGRGLKLTPSAVKQVALAHDIAVAQPTSLKLNGKYPDEAAAGHAAIIAAQADVMVVAAYGLILPADVLALPAQGCVNIHASLLPRWRGAAPIHRAIEAGDAATGITLMQMDAGLDTGAMLAVESIPIAQHNQASLHDALAAMGAQMIVGYLQKLQAGTNVPATPQPDAGVTYAEKIRKEEARLDWTQSAATLARKIRAFNPSPATFAAIDDASGFKIFEAHVLADAVTDLPAGTIVQADKNGLDIACGQGVLRIIEAQRAGGKRMSAAQFLDSLPLQAGAILL